MKFNLNARIKADCLANEFNAMLELKHGQKGQAFRDAANRLKNLGIKIGPSGVKNLFARYKIYGLDALLDRRMVEFPIEHRLPKDFVRYLKQLRVNKQDTFAGVWRKLIADWEKGEPMPGYDELPKVDATTGHPRGWSLKHLCRMSRPSAFDRAAKSLKDKVDHSSKFTALLASLDKLKLEILDLRAEILKEKLIHE